MAEEKAGTKRGELARNHPPPKKKEGEYGCVYLRHATPNAVPSFPGACFRRTPAWSAFPRSYRRAPACAAVRSSAPSRFAARQS
jgi:hypothetical protein